MCVSVPARDDLTNTFAMVRCLSADEEGCYGELVEAGNG